MPQSLPGWIETLGAQTLRRAAQLWRLAAGPDLHVTLVIARTANRARMRRTGAGLFNSRVER